MTGQDSEYEAIHEEGYNAGLSGARSTDNPYETGSDKAKAWRDGQSDGNDDAVSAGK